MTGHWAFLLLVGWSSADGVSIAGNLSFRVHALLCLEGLAHTHAVATKICKFVLESGATAQISSSANYGLPYSHRASQLNPAFHSLCQLYSLSSRLSSTTLATNSVSSSIAYSSTSWVNQPTVRFGVGLLAECQACGSLTMHVYGTV